MTLRTLPKTSAADGQTGVFVRGRVSKYTFSRNARVRAKADYAEIFARGKRTAEPRLALHWLVDAVPPRLGLAVSRKVDRNAVGRNRIKRQMREQFRHLRPCLKPGRYVVVARAAAAKASNAELANALEQLLLRAGALPQTVSPGTMPPVSSVSSS